MPKYAQLDGKYPLKLKYADTPSNILWENLELSNWNRRGRKMVFAIVIILSMLITTCMVIAGSYYNVNYNKFRLPLKIKLKRTI